jgi:hypothetical protein
MPLHRDNHGGRVHEHLSGDTLRWLRHTENYRCFQRLLLCLVLFLRMFFLATHPEFIAPVYIYH